MTDTIGGERERGRAFMRVVPKPWGREVWWAQTDRYVGKIIEVRRGESLSLQYHRVKLETMYFQSGEAELVLGDETRRVGPGDAVTIPPGTRHRLTALSDLTLFEVSTPEVEDVVRLEDRYGRVGGEA
ncbi:MAG: cupin domain-containing protein [Thermaerobacter sp.]|nr:cupin domain-containing protein [Thermaerobacter sp.]